MKPREKKPFIIICNECGNRTDIDFELVQDYHTSGYSTEIGSSNYEHNRLAFRIKCDRCGNKFLYWIEESGFPQVVEILKGNKEGS